LSKDPSLFRGGFNLYSYSHNDPINYIDSDGKNPILIVAAFLFVSLADNQHEANKAAATQIVAPFAGAAVGKIIAPIFRAGSELLSSVAGRAACGAAEGAGAAETFGEYLAGKAPKQVTPGTTTLEGQYVNDLGRVEPWTAHYDQYGRLVGRTDYNAGNMSQGIPDTHFHVYDWSTRGAAGQEVMSHVPGEYVP
jgi:hypothetical protein